MDRHQYYHEPSCISCSLSFCFKDPKIPIGARCPLLLKCGHSMCEGCLRSITRTQTEVKCSLCSTVSVARKYSKNAELREDFPLNVYAVAQVSLKCFGDNRKDNSSSIGFYKPKETMAATKVPATLCCECNSIPAVWKCQQCNEPFCDKCFDKIHSAGVTLRKHKKETFTDTGKKLDDEVKCGVHPGEILQYYCEECSQYSCVACLEMKHAHHTHITIGEKNSEVFQEFSDAFDEATGVLLQLKASKKKITNNAQLKDEESQKVQRQLALHYNHLHGLLQLQEEEFTKRIKQSEEKTLSSLDHVYQELEDTIQELENAISESKRCAEPEFFLNIPIFHTLEKLKNLCESPCHIVLNKDNDNTNYRFFVGSDVEEMIKGHCTVTVPNNRVYELRTKSRLPDEYIPDQIPEASKTTLKRPVILNLLRETKPIIEPVIPPQFIQPIRGNIPSADIKSNIDTSPVPDLLQANKVVSNKVIDDNVSVTSADSDVDKTFNTPPLKEGSTEVVRLCHLISPSDFYIQRECCYQQLLIMGKFFSKRANIKAKHPDSIELGQRYLLQFKDKKWYRAVVKKIVGVRCEIFYIDYGNTETVAKDSLREIPEKFMRIPPLAVHCSLFGCAPLENAWGQSAIGLMAQLSNSVDLLMHVEKVDEAASFHEVSLTRCDEAGGSLADILIFLGVAYRIDNAVLPGYTQYQPRSTSKIKYTNISIEKGERFDGQVTHINTPTNFYIQQITDGGKCLIELMKEINSYYSQLHPTEQLVFNPVNGTPVAAKYADGRWYRAQIIRVPKPLFVEVQYVDFGNIDTVLYTDLRLMQPRFMKVGIQGLKCKLSDIAPKKEKGWSVSATKEFQNLAKKNVLYHVYVDNVTDSQLSIILYDRQLYKEIIINGVLVKRGHAKSVGINSALAEYSCVSNFNSEADYSTISSNVTMNQQKILPQAPSDDGNLSISSSSSSLASDSMKHSDNSERIKIKILKYISPDEIHFTFENLIKGITRLNNEMTQYYNGTEIEGRNWEKDDLCAVRKDDNKWYRGLIVNFTNGIYQVFIKDIVESVEVEAADLRSLHSRFTNVTDGSFKCHLSAILPAGGGKKWSASSYDFMTERIKKYPDLYLKKLGDLVNGSLPVQLWAKYLKTGGPLDPVIEDWRDINQDLIDCGYALPDTKSSHYSALRKNDYDTEATGWHQYIYENDRSPSPIQNCQKRNTSQVKFQGVGPRSKVTDRKTYESCETITYTQVSEILDWRNADPFPRLNFLAVPTYIDEDFGIFLHDKELATYLLETIQRGMSSMHEGSNPKPHDLVWAPGQPCIALFHVENKWYRAKVTKVLDDGVEVYFVDYGNTEIVTHDQLRKKLCMENVPIQCHRCVFRGLSPISENGKWSNRVFDYVHPSIVEKECQVQLQPPETVGGDYIIEKFFLPGGEDLVSILVSMHYATYTVDDNSWSQTQTSALDLIPLSHSLMNDEETESNSNNPDVLEYLDNLTESQLKPYVDDWFDQLQITPGEIKNMPSYRDWILPEGLTEVHITILSVHANCIILFNILSSDDPEVMEVLDEFLVLQARVEGEADSQPKLVAPVKGQACVGCYTNDDVWYRAVITDVYKNGTVKVYYVDYGNEEILSNERLREPKEEWLAIPSQAISANLYNLTKGPNYNKLICQKLLSVAFSSPPYLISIEKRQPDLQVDIFNEAGELPYQSIIDAGVLSRKME